MDASAAAELKAVLVGVDLPADKPALLEYAVRQHTDPSQIAVLRSLPDREFVSLDEVTEQVLHLQPAPNDGVRTPHEESGAPPGGAAYT